MIFDVGANIGQSVETYRAVFPKARSHAFEPLPKAYRQSRRSQSNQLIFAARARCSSQLSAARVRSRKGGLAAGCAILTTSAEIQRSIVGDAAGSFVDPTAPAEVAAALTQLVADRAGLRSKMFAARERFAQFYEPSVVGALYARLLWDTAGRRSEPVARAGET